jgi:energy-coupling factor transport system ATP-binding protein
MTIQFKDVSYEYSPNTPFAYGALKHVSVAIKQGRVTAIIGATGSGKTTLVQHLNALLLPTEGEVHILDRVIVASEKPKQLKSLRQHVGLVFQFPEYQLFEETVIKDVCFGPLNFNISKEEALKKAHHALEVVGLDKDVAEKSPLDLSGGQKRRAAIAGILAIDPDVLVLDEPTAGLDPQGSQAMMELFLRLNKQSNKTILIVTHDMEHVFAHCDDVVVVDHGEVIYESTVSEFFFNDELIKKLNIDLPKVIQLHRLLKEQGISIDPSITDLDEIAKHIAKVRGVHHE